MKFKFVRYRMLVTVHEIDADSEEKAYEKYETESVPRAVEVTWVNRPSHSPETDVLFEIPEDMIEKYLWSYPYEVGERVYSCEGCDEGCHRDCPAIGCDYLDWRC